MGTNYYHRKDVCPHCGRAGEEVHIGKSSGGWSFSFHGTEEVRSYAEWLKVLEAGGEIRDECGDVVTLKDFKALVEAKRGGKRHYDYMQQDYGYSFDPSQEWLDPEGHSFSGGEFS